MAVAVLAPINAAVPRDSVVITVKLVIVSSGLVKGNVNMVIACPIRLASVRMVFMVVFVTDVSFNIYILNIKNNNFIFCIILGVKKH